MRFAIVASTSVVERFALFTWTRDAQSGIDRAKREALEFGMTDLHNFRAEPLEDIPS